MVEDVMEGSEEKIEKVDLLKYYGMFGKASAERLEELEGEAPLHSQISKETRRFANLAI